MKPFFCPSPRMILAGLFGLLSACLLPAQTPPAKSWRAIATPAQVTKLEEEISQVLKGAYMHEKDLGAIKVAGWEDFPTRRYSYISKTGANQSVEVILLDPDVKKAADWVGNAIVDAFGSYDEAKAAGLVKRISGESGFQFPVTGFVDEQEHGLYVFRDGIAVQFAKGNALEAVMKEWVVKAGTTIKQPLTEAALAMPSSDVALTGRQGRPASISPEEFSQGVPRPKKEEDRERWDRMKLRSAYQAAWNSDRNALISQLVKAYPKGDYP